MNGDSMRALRPLAAAGAVWDVAGFRIRRAGGGAVCCCEIEVLERGRQFYRSFALQYEPSWFEIWDCAEDDYAAIAEHARRWVSLFLGFRHQPANFSTAEWPYKASIRW